MSGLVRFAKKVGKKLVEGTKKVLKSKIFKVVAIAAAVIFTGGAALGAIGAIGAGGGVMGALSAGFAGGMSALGTVGGAIMSGIQATGGAIANGVRAIVPGGATGAGGAVAHGINGTAQGASMGFINGSTVAPTAGKVATFFGDPLVKAAAVSGAGQMISGYAQGRAQQEQLDQIEEQRLNRDQYGYNGYGNKTGDLVDPRSRIAEITGNQDPGTRVGLDAPPPTVQAPAVENSMRNRLLASLDGLKIQPAAVGV